MSGHFYLTLNLVLIQLLSQQFLNIQLSKKCLKKLFRSLTQHLRYCFLGSYFLNVFFFYKLFLQTLSNFSYSYGHLATTSPYHMRAP